MKQQDLRGTKVKFCIISKDSKGKDKYAIHRGRIKSINKSGTGFVIYGDSIPGLYNRCMSDITFIDEEVSMPAIEIIDFTEKCMEVAV